jgi:hypothetical protein
VISPRAMISAVDATPFVSLADDIGSRSNLYIFADKKKQPDRVWDAFLKWSRTTSSAIGPGHTSYCFIARRNHYLKLRLGPIESIGRDQDQDQDQDQVIDIGDEFGEDVDYESRDFPGLKGYSE